MLIWASVGTTATTTTAYDNNLVGLYAATASTTSYSYLDMNAQQYFALAQARVVSQTNAAHANAIISQQYYAAQAQAQVAQQALAQQAQQAAQQWNDEYEAARLRSRKLLLEHLTPEQKKTFERNNWFVVQGGKSRKDYRIKTGNSFSRNIEELKKDKVVAILCCHTASVIPMYDHFLAQKIALELDEEHFLSIANRSVIAA